MLNNMALHQLVPAAFLALLALLFVFLFAIPAIRQRILLARVLKQLKALKREAPLSEYEKIFGRNDRLRHLWKEYKDSLHAQEVMRDGVSVVAAVRATVPAETYLSPHVLVDSPLRADFFKHLPGILTGLGIIGTFWGLIEGLRSFTVSDDPDAVRNGLESLMGAVGGAFVVSGSAIALAISVTIIEKLMLTHLHGVALRIVQEVDSRFDAGAGEEYLSRLVRASEDSASQSKILKDALVRELGDVLREIAATQSDTNERLSSQLGQRIELQTAAAREDQQALKSSLVAAISESLKAPLEEIAGTVRNASGDQSAAAVRMLQDVMSSFSQRLNDLFGNQINGINELNRQTAEGIQNAVHGLTALVDKMEASGQRSSEKIGEQVERAIERMEQRQSELNAQSETLATQVRDLVEQSQTRATTQMEQTMTRMGEELGAALARLQSVQSSAMDAAAAQGQAVSATAQTAISNITSAVEQAARSLSDASAAMASSVATLSDTTRTSVDRMHAGAERLHTAATAFADAGNGVGGVLERASVISGKLTETSASLTAGAGALQAALLDYRAQRDAMTTAVEELRQIIDGARREASITADVLHRIEESSQRLRDAQQAAHDYMEGINDVISSSTDTFRDSVRTTIDQVNTSFHERLSEAVGMLASTVQDLDDTLTGLVPQR
ncbi:anti-phage ZorAB system protein ZorA [Lysobacter rhizosphaerae]